MCVLVSHMKSEPSKLFYLRNALHLVNSVAVVLGAVSTSLLVQVSHKQSSYVNSEDSSPPCLSTPAEVAGTLPQFSKTKCRKNRILATVCDKRPGNFFVQWLTDCSDPDNSDLHNISCSSEELPGIS